MKQEATTGCASSRTFLFVQERSFYIKGVQAGSQKRANAAKIGEQSTADRPASLHLPASLPRPSAPALPLLQRRHWRPFLLAVTTLFLSNLLVLLPLD